MILSASRRTDIPCCYSDWFFNRIKEGFLYVRNPVNPKQVSRVSLTPDVVDCIVFWTKNPMPMMDRLNELEGYPFYFQFTLTGYGRDLEPGLPDKKRVLIPVFQQLSQRLGRERVIWRYDPVFLNEKYKPEYHVKAFREIASRLTNYTEQTVISFGDMYAKTQRNTESMGIRPPLKEEITFLAAEFSAAAKEAGMKLVTCAEQVGLEAFGIEHGSCIDRQLVEKICGSQLKCGSDRGQGRQACGCAASVEIGAYDTCILGCSYCYANANRETVRKRKAQYCPESPILCDSLKKDDHITERRMRSQKTGQLSML